MSITNTKIFQHAGDWDRRPDADNYAYGRAEQKALQRAKARRDAAQMSVSSVVEQPEIAALPVGGQHQLAESAGQPVVHAQLAGEAQPDEAA